MNLKYFFLLNLILTLFNNLKGQNFDKHRNINTRGQNATSIIVEIDSDLMLSDDSSSLEYRPLETIGVSEWTMMKVKMTNGKAKWTILSNIPISILIRLSKNGNRFNFFCEVNDSLSLTFSKSVLSCFGLGNKKVILLHQIDSLKNVIAKPANINQFVCTSTSDFIDYHQYKNRQRTEILSLIDASQNSLSEFAFNYIRVNSISRLEEDRLDKFNALMRQSENIGLNKEALCNIFDSCFYSTPAKWALNHYQATGWYAFVRAQVARQYRYDFTKDSLTSPSLRKFLYFEQGKKTFSGILLEKFMLRLITAETIHEIGFNPITEKLIETYYKEAKNKEYIDYVKSYEAKARLLRNGQNAPAFSLVDRQGNPITNEDLKGKVVLMDFWFTGCSGCIQMAPVLQRVENVFKNDTNVIFMSVSTDMQQAIWEKSVQGKKYTTGKALNLFTGGLGANHAIVKVYSLTEYPSLFLIDALGKIVDNPLPDPRKDNGENLILEISKQLSLMRDGPYLIYDKGSMTEFAIAGGKVIKKAVNKKSHSVTVFTDTYKDSFTFPLKKQIQYEPSIFQEPSKLFVLSDIEGNFGAFRNLLQVNNVIDSKYNWTFGKGHLVICGDMFDRGAQVTECLWLIYALEEKAKVAGGYVHFILGNHEIMNLNGDLRYAKPKYIDNLTLLGKSYQEVYGSISELGRWLRAKNIMEKIGDKLFLHAGISEELNRSVLDIKQINRLARLYYDKDSLARQSPDKNLSIIFNTTLSPFWYRSYYMSTEYKTYPQGDTVYRATIEQVDRTLEKFMVKTIITGHTVIADTISIHFDGRIINTDTKHAEGKSEALLIEDNAFYRVNLSGDKKLLKQESTLVRTKFP